MTMKQDMINKLHTWADRYEVEGFRARDPLFCPASYTITRDVEITAFIAQWLAYGNRRAFMNELTKMRIRMGTENFGPSDYIAQRKYACYENNTNTLYRFYTYHDFYELCEGLHLIYESHTYMVDAVVKQLLDRADTATDPTILLQAIISLFPSVKGIPKDTKSACKRLNMFLRWMVRKGPADLGTWAMQYPEQFTTDRLLCPLDVHVGKIARRLGLITYNENDMRAVMELTANMREIFPGDPARGDFALYGYEINDSRFTRGEL